MYLMCQEADRLIFRGENPACCAMSSEDEERTAFALRPIHLSSVRTKRRGLYCGEVLSPHRRGHFCFKLFMKSLNMTRHTTLALDRFKPVPKILFESFRSLVCEGNMPLWPRQCQHSGERKAQGLGQES